MYHQNIYNSLENTLRNYNKSLVPVSYSVLPERPFNYSVQGLPSNNRFDSRRLYDCSIGIRRPSSNYDPGSVAGPYQSGQVNYEKLSSDELWQEKEMHLSFLRPDRPPQRIVGASEEILGGIRECFVKTTGQILPKDINIAIVSEKEFDKLCKSEKLALSAKSCLGFAINSDAPGSLKEVFVKKNELDILFLVLGHEIGHVITERLPDKYDEEAKAFAFELAWAMAIRDHDIMGLRRSLNSGFGIAPAKNGLHDVSMRFVQACILQGRSPLNIFRALSDGRLSLRDLC